MTNEEKARVLRQAVDIYAEGRPQNDGTIRMNLKLVADELDPPMTPGRAAREVYSKLISPAEVIDHGDGWKWAPWEQLGEARRDVWESVARAARAVK